MHLFDYEHRYLNFLNVTGWLTSDQTRTFFVESLFVNSATELGLLTLYGFASPHAVTWRGDAYFRVGHDDWLLAAACSVYRKTPKLYSGHDYLFVSLHV